MLDVVLYQLAQRVACQRYRQPNLDAKSKLSAVKTAFASLFARPAFSIA